jgi:hypothetical protein
LVPPIISWTICCCLSCSTGECLRLKDELDAPRKLACVYPCDGGFCDHQHGQNPWGIIERFYFPLYRWWPYWRRSSLRFEWPKERRAPGWASGCCWRRPARWFSRCGRGDVKFRRLHVFRLFQLLDSLYYPVILSICWRRYLDQKISLGQRRHSAVLHRGHAGFAPDAQLQVFRALPKTHDRYATIMYPFRTFSEDLTLRRG